MGRLVGEALDAPVGRPIGEARGHTVGEEDLFQAAIGEEAERDVLRGRCRQASHEAAAVELVGPGGAAGLL